MSASPLVRLEIPEPGIGHIRMVDERGHNGLSPAFVDALLDVLDDVANTPTFKVVLLSGTPEYFCSGATRGMLDDLKARRLAPTELVLGLRLLDLPIPVVAVAEGSAIGGGLALLLSADMVLIAREARYGANFMALGITPGMGMTRILETVLSPALAHELLYAADLRRGSSFEGVSGFNAILPREELAERARALAWTIAEHPRENLRLLKRALTLPRRRTLVEAMTLESLMHEASLARLDTGGIP